MFIRKAPVDKCPFCESDSGFYTKEQVHGSINVRHNYDGSEAENGSMYECLSYKGGKFAYCLDCKRRLFKMSEISEQHPR
ncbi:MAG: hypothetical protein AB7G87_01405 [Clostridia bacterium]